MAFKDYTGQKNAEEFKFEKTEELAILDRNAKGWQVELNKVSFNGGEPKLDLRSWSPDGKMGKGIVLRDEVAQNLYLALTDYFSEDSADNSEGVLNRETEYPEDFKEPGLPMN